MNALQLSPMSLVELQQVLQLAKKRNQHVIVSSTKSVAEATNNEVVINMKNFNKVIEIDMTSKRVTVEPNVTFVKLDFYLKKVGLSFPICDFNEQMTVGSAVSTGATGSILAGSLSPYVTSLQLLTSSNQVITCDFGTDYHSAVCTGFGSCGVIVSLTLQCEQRFSLELEQFGCSFETIIDNLHNCVEKYQNFSIDWFPHTNNAVFKSVKKIPEKESNDFGRLDKSVSWILDDFLGWYLLEFFYWICLVFPFFIPLCHLIIFYLAFIWKRKKVVIPHSSIQTRNAHVTEWMVPIDKAVSTLKNIRQWCSTSCHFLHFPLEIRFINADSSYLSPVSSKIACAIKLTINRPLNFYFPYEHAFEDFGKIMQQHNAKPNLSQTHFNLDIETIFSNFDQWTSVRAKLDEINLFNNKFKKSN